jgi:adenylate cyclase
VRCAIEVPNVLIERNAGLPPDGHIDFGVGIHLGDVVEEVGGWQRMLPLETRANLAPS